MHWDKRHTRKGGVGAGKKEKVSRKEEIKNSLCVIIYNTQSISTHITSLGPDLAGPRSSSSDTLSACALPSVPFPCGHCPPLASSRIMTTVYMWFPQGAFLATQSRMFSSLTPGHPPLSTAMVWVFFSLHRTSTVQTFSCIGVLCMVSFPTRK